MTSIMEAESGQQAYKPTIKHNWGAVILFAFVNAFVVALINSRGNTFEPLILFVSTWTFTFLVGFLLRRGFAKGLTVVVIGTVTALAGGIVVHHIWGVIVVYLIMLFTGLMVEGDSNR